MSSEAELTPLPREILRSMQLLEPSLSDNLACAHDEVFVWARLEDRSTIVCTREPVRDRELLANVVFELALALRIERETGLQAATVSIDGFVVARTLVWKRSAPELPDFEPVLATLKQVHAAGVVHGGLCPDWISPTSPHICGWGLVRVVAAWRSRQHEQFIGLMGDPLYATRDEHMGLPPSKRDDVLALARSYAVHGGSLPARQLDLHNGVAMLLAVQREHPDPVIRALPASDRSSAQQYLKSIEAGEWVADESRMGEPRSSNLSSTSTSAPEPKPKPQPEPSFPLPRERVEFSRLMAAIPMSRVLFLFCLLVALPLISSIVGVGVVRSLRPSVAPGDPHPSVASSSPGQDQQPPIEAKSPRQLVIANGQASGTEPAPPGPAVSEFGSGDGGIEGLTERYDWNDERPPKGGWRCPEFEREAMRVPFRSYDNQNGLHLSKQENQELLALMEHAQACNLYVELENFTTRTKLEDFMHWLKDVVADDGGELCGDILSPGCLRFVVTTRGTSGGKHAANFRLGAPESDM